jgi:transglutaminase-like putative cysteine protease
VIGSLEGPTELIDHRGVDWARVRRTAYLLHQRLRYEYPGPIRDLRQRLVVFPPDLHGGQHLVARHLQVSAPNATAQEQIDRFGNRICELSIPQVDAALEFEIRFLVERKAGFGGVPPEQMRDPLYLQPSPLTEPDAHFREIAAGLATRYPPGALTERIAEWVWQNLAYRRDVTDVKTTASQALGRGQGVCQDQAHVMLVLCRLLGLPARYVSGHLLGEGATHAWVEVLAPDPVRPARRSIQAFDPSHGRRCRPDYITVAVGRDYADVAPTSGYFTAPYAGRLSTYKRAGITSLEYDDVRAEPDKLPRAAEPPISRLPAHEARSA